MIAVRDGTAADRDFVIDAARRFAAFGPPPWRSSLEVIGGEVRCLDDFFDGRLRGPRLIIAEEAGVACGFAFLEPAIDYFTGEPQGHLGMIAVTDEAEGRGVGRMLLGAAEAWARASGFARLTLNVFEGNARARRLYDAAGYRVETLRYFKLL